MNTTEYLTIRSKIKARYRGDLEALERVWRLANPDESLPSVDRPAETLPKSTGRGVFSHGSAIPGKPRQASGEVLSAVGQAIESLIIFDWKDVRKVILQTKPGTAVKRTSIVQVLQNLVESHQLAVYRKGAGRRATQYQKSSPLPAEAHVAPPDKPKEERLCL